MPRATTASKPTPLHRVHLELGARMAPFAGFLMPMQYTSMTAEHQSVRENVGLFDLSHMGEFSIGGPAALEFLQKVTCNDASSLGSGDIQYTALLYENGTFVDDLLLYRMSDYWIMVVNASNIEKDFAWLMSQRFGEITLENHSDDYALLALQGPNAAKTMAELTEFDLDTIKYHHHATVQVGDIHALVSRTGYTGEDGFEIYLRPNQAEAAWSAISAAGKKYNLTPVGLGARDTLRLEMKMALYGNDIDQTTTALEAGLFWIVKPDKGDFIGRQALLDQKELGVPRKLVCIEFSERCVPRPGYSLLDESGSELGAVTSGAFSPTLKKPIAMGYVPTGRSKVGMPVSVRIRERLFAGQIVKAPFYRRES